MAKSSLATPVCADVEGIRVDFKSFVLGPISFGWTGVVGLVGPNGAGKTTLLSALSGMLPTAAGVIRLAGRVLSDVDKRRSVGLSAAQHYYPNVTFAQTLSFVRPFYPSWSHAVEAELASRFSIPTDKYVGQASSGMLMKFSLLRAFAQGTPLLCFDEPWNALDPTGRIELSEAIERLCKETQRAVLVSSHDLSLLNKIADRVLFIDNGRIVGETDGGKMGRETAAIDPLEMEYRKRFL